MKKGCHLAALFDVYVTGLIGLAAQECRDFDPVLILLRSAPRLCRYVTLLNRRLLTRLRCIRLIAGHAVNQRVQTKPGATGGLLLLLGLFDLLLGLNRSTLRRGGGLLGSCLQANDCFG
jgi:hypothetical protein